MSFQVSEFDDVRFVPEIPFLGKFVFYFDKLVNIAENVTALQSFLLVNYVE